MAAKAVTLTFAGDSQQLESTLKDVGAGAKTMASKLDTAGDDAKRFGTKLDDVGAASGGAEGKFSGMADVLDGLGGAFGLPTEKATGLMRSFGDLSGGLEPVLGMVSGMGTKLAELATKTGLTSAATAVWTTIQGAFNAVMALNPIALVVIAVAALTAALILAYQNSETFRDIVDGVFRLVAKVAGEYLGFVLDRISDIIGAIATVLEKIPGMGGVADKLRDAQDKIDGMSESVKKFGDKTDDARAKVSLFKGELAHLNTVSVHQGAPIFTVSKSGPVRARQHGGPVSAGSPYLVGEAGPELFIPGRSGGIVPHGAAGGRTIIINSYSLDPAVAGPAVMRAIEEYEDRNGTQFARAG